MMGQDIYSRNCKPMIGVASVGFTLATFCKLGGAAVQACSPLGNTAWVALALLRSVILLADWHGVVTYLSEDSRVLQHLFLVVGSLWPLLCAMANFAK
jgi:hypothetical protein